MAVVLRELEPADFTAVIELNNDAVPAVPMVDDDELALLTEYASLAVVAVDEQDLGRPLGFVLAMDPGLILLDEPTASLDPDVALEVRDFVRRQREEEGVSVLHTSHNMDEVAEICDRVIFLDRGAIAAEGRPSELAATWSFGPGSTSR